MISATNATKERILSAKGRNTSEGDIKTVMVESPYDPTDVRKLNNVAIATQLYPYLQTNQYYKRFIETGPRPSPVAVIFLTIISRQTL